EWDTTQASKHAIDYITHYNRLLPHQFGLHTTPELIQPLDGLTATFASSNTFLIPSPSVADSPVAGQPAASFNALPTEEHLMTIWNGTIASLSYLSEGSLTNSAASTQLSIDFNAESSDVVIAWGGHIATRADWGTNNSATSISGSPYHTRLIEL